MILDFRYVYFRKTDDADVKVTATGAIAQMYIRKQGIFTEKRFFHMQSLRI